MPGMYCRVELDLGSRPDALQVPLRALLEGTSEDSATRLRGQARSTAVFLITDGHIDTPSRLLSAGEDAPIVPARPQFMRAGQNDNLDFDGTDEGFGPNFRKMKDDLDVPAFLRKQMD